MKKIKLHLYLLLLVVLAFTSCIEKEQAFTTFTGDLIYSFLKKDTTYSEFVKVVDKAGLKGMLSAYGQYTCLAPTNNAFRRYYKSLGTNFSFTNLTEAQVDTLARMHIVQNTYLTYNLEVGVLPNSNMMQRFIEVKIDAMTMKMVLNDSSQIVSKDNEVYNGVVQGIDRILQSSNFQLPDFIKSNPQLSIFSEALVLTRLSDSLRKIEDKNYKMLEGYNDDYQNRQVLQPTHRRFAYTAFVESNELLKSYNIKNIADLIQKAKELYPSDNQYDNDYTNRNNSLNKFIAYHLINKIIPLNKFFYSDNATKNYTPDEFLETMLPYHLIRASRVNSQVTLNSGSTQTAHVLETGSKTTINGVYHFVDKILAYTENVEQSLTSTRFRFDVACLFPELTNNNMRGSRNVCQVRNSTGDSYNLNMGYCDYIKTNKDTRIMYQAGKKDQWGEFQADDFEIIGPYDFTFRLLPVPPGTYELRYCYAVWVDRSTTQIYFDNKPIGIPIDLTILASNPKMGWIRDSETSDNGYENDKMMRNRGYMKGPTTIISNGGPARDDSYKIRVVVGTFTFNNYEAHTLRFKTVLQDAKRNCTLDYFELVPKSVFSPISGEPESRE